MTSPFLNNLFNTYKQPIYLERVVAAGDVAVLAVRATDVGGDDLDERERREREGEEGKRRQGEERECTTSGQKLSLTSFVRT